MSKQEMKADAIVLLLPQILHKKYNKFIMKAEQVKIVCQSNSITL